MGDGRAEDSGAVSIQVSLAPQGALAGSVPAASVELPDGASVEDLLVTAGLDPRTCLAVVGGTVLPRQAAVPDRARVLLYPVQAGG